MKKIIIFICVIAVSITINSCKKNQWYGCCDKGHPHWEGTKYNTDDDLDMRKEKQNHDANVHGGVPTATTCYK